MKNTVIVRNSMQGAMVDGALELQPASSLAGVKKTVCVGCEKHRSAHKQVELSSSPMSMPSAVAPRPNVPVRQSRANTIPIRKPQFPQLPFPFPQLPQLSQLPQFPQLPQLPMAKPPVLNENVATAQAITAVDMGMAKSAGLAVDVARTFPDSKAIPQVLAMNTLSNFALAPLEMFRIVIDSIRMSTIR